MLEQDGVKFDEGTWNLLRMRGMAIIAVIIYPLWSPVYQWINPNFFDPLLDRLLVCSIPFLVAVLSFRPTMDRTKLRHLYHIFTFSMTAHVFLLIYANDITVLYVLGGYAMMFSAGLATASIGAVYLYFTLCLIGSVSLCVLKPTENSFILLAGVVTSASTSIWVQRTMLSLTSRLSRNRKQIESKNEMLASMLNSLGQGFLTFGSDGLCRPVFSRACLALLETDPGGKPIWDVLKIQVPIDDFFRDFFKRSFDSEDDFFRLESIFPVEFPHTQDRKIRLEFRPTMKADGSITEVVMIATDRTDVIRAEKAAEAEKRHSMMIATIVRQKRFFRVFISNYNESIAKFKIVTGEASIIEFKRFLHSLKGGASMFFIDDIAKLAHRLEDEWKETSSSSLIAEQLNTLEVSMANFMRANSDVLGNEFSAERQAEIPISTFSRLINERYFADAPRELREAILALTEQPVGRYFESYSDLVTRLARHQSKKIKNIRIIGGDVSIFPEPYLDLFSTFVHIFRNAVDHGLETPAAREAAGKAAEGEISVEFSSLKEKDRNWLKIEVRDDGGGIDPNQVREKIRRQGDVVNARDFNDEEILQVIFNPGFSTKSIVTEVSGRGVGLDAVKSAVQELGGNIIVRSVLGRGTVVTLRVPIMDAAGFLKRLSLSA